MEEAPRQREPNRTFSLLALGEALLTGLAAGLLYWINGDFGFVLLTVVFAFGAGALAVERGLKSHWIAGAWMTLFIALSVARFLLFPPFDMVAFNRCVREQNRVFRAQDEAIERTGSFLSEEDLVRRGFLDHESAWYEIRLERDQGSQAYFGTGRFFSPCRGLSFVSSESEFEVGS